MKYLTREAIGPYSTDSQIESAYLAYKTHLSEFQNLMGPDLNMLAFSSNLNDGRIKSLVKNKYQIRVEIVVGDLQSGYQKLSVEYNSALLIGPSLSIIAAIEDDRDIIADEIIRKDDRFWRHNILFDTDGEMAIEFGSVRLISELASDHARYDEVQSIRI